MYHVHPLMCVWHVHCTCLYTGTLLCRILTREATSKPDAKEQTSRLVAIDMLGGMLATLFEHKVRAICMGMCVCLCEGRMLANLSLVCPTPGEASRGATRLPAAQ